MASQVASTTPVTPSPTRGERAKSALIGVRKFLEEKLAADRPHQNLPLDLTPALAFNKSGHFRRSYGPDFLELFANKYMTTRRDRGERRKLNVITGPKAENMYRKFVRRTYGEQKALDSTVDTATRPVVFAFNDKDRNGVKFYKTWRNQKDAGRNSEPTQNGSLDAEFDRVLGYLDAEFNRMSAASVVSLPYLQSVVLDTAGSQSEESLNRPLKPTNPDSVSDGSVCEQPKSSEMQEPSVRSIDTSIGIEKDSKSCNIAPDIVVSSAELSLNPEEAAPVDAHCSDLVMGAASLSVKQDNQTPGPVKESLSIPQLPRLSGRRRKSHNRLKGAHSDETISESYLTDASSGENSLSGASDRTEGSSPNGARGVSEFTIVLLEEDKDYSLIRRNRKLPSSSKTDASEEVTPWWAHLGQLPPFHLGVPRLFNPSSDHPTAEVAPWWTPHTNPSKTKKSQTPDKSEYRSRPHPEVTSTTWKKYMEPVLHPPHGIHEHDTGLAEYVTPHVLSPVGYYPSPVLYSVPYASPGPSWGSYIDGSPMGHFSDYSDSVQLPNQDLLTPIKHPTFTDAVGYPYLTG